MRHTRLNPLPATTPAPVFPGLEMASAWGELQYLVLPAGAQCGSSAAPDREVGYILLGGAIDLEGPDLGAQFEGPTALLCGVGWPHTLANAGAGTAQLLRFSAALQGNAPAAPTFRAESVDQARLKWRPAIHGGAGQIATRHIWGPGDFSSPWVFLDHAVLAPQSSLGYHYHDALEECFVVLSGQGYITISDQTLAVGPGSVTWQGIGQPHGLYNSGGEPLDFLRVAVGIRGEQYTTIDLNDSLLKRKPSS